MTGGINLTPEAERQLNELDDWITKRTSADIAQRFVSAILDHIEAIPAFPYAGRARDDVRPAVRTTTFKNRTLVADEVDESSGELLVNILGVFQEAMTGKQRSERGRAIRTGGR